MEEWRTIQDFPDYQVSNMGNVKSLKTEKILTPYLLKQKYHLIRIKKNKIIHRFLIHRLVAEAFIDNPDNKSQIDHINRNSLDNRVENLRWATQSENSLNRNNWSIGTNTKEKYISCNSKDKRYYFRKTTNYKYIQKDFKTLEEAIAYRDSILNQTSLQSIS